MTDTAILITQLRVLAHLTRTEAQVARLRVAQATGDDVRDELRRNAADADARAARIDGALRDLGALPDLVTPALGRVAALARGALEQAQPLDEAVLGDLTLEHQLRDRARYVVALAEAADLPAVRALADHLVAAHSETVEWLDRLLADLGAGRPAALGASPLQRVAAQVARTANAPGRVALDEVGGAVSRTIGTVGQAGGKARAVVGTAVNAGQEALTAGRDTAAQAVSAGQGALTAGRDTAAQAAGTVVTAGQSTLVAGRDAAAQVAGHLTRRVTGTGQDTGQDTAEDTAPDTAPGTAPDTAPDTAEDTAPDASEQAADPAGPAAGAGADPAPDAADLPVPGFAELPAHSAVAALRSLDRPADVAAVLAFELAHDNRPAVVAAARIRADAVGGD
jgi:bacterioferritin (cytochrome b1)